VRVVPEVDVPAHALSWGAAYPSLIINCTVAAKRFGAPSDVPTLDPSRQETYTLIETLLTEVAQIFPDRFLHVGGDGVRCVCARCSKGV